MPQRTDAGPVVAAVGAVVLFLSLFLSWYDPDVSGWDAFETLDLLLGGLAVAAAMLAAGQLGASFAQGIDLRLLPLLGALAVAAVGITLLQGPPGTEGADPGSGAWVALAASILVLAGGALSAARISVTVTVAGRDGRPSSSMTATAPPAGATWNRMTSNVASTLSWWGDPRGCRRGRRPAGR